MIVSSAVQATYCPRQQCRASATIPHPGTPYHASSLRGHYHTPLHMHWCPAMLAQGCLSCCTARRAHTSLAVVDVLVADAVHKQWLSVLLSQHHESQATRGLHGRGALQASPGWAERQQSSSDLAQAVAAQLQQFILPVEAPSKQAQCLCRPILQCRSTCTLSPCAAELGSAAACLAAPQADAPCTAV